MCVCVDARGPRVPCIFACACAVCVCLLPHRYSNVNVHVLCVCVCVCVFVCVCVYMRTLRVNHCTEISKSRGRLPLERNTKDNVYRLKSSQSNTLR